MDRTNAQLDIRGVYLEDFDPELTLIFVLLNAYWSQFCEKMRPLSRVFGNCEEKCHSNFQAFRRLLPTLICVFR